MIYFIRHAQSEANKEGVFAGGSVDTKLTDDGINLFLDFSRKNNHEFKKIYVSTLTRSIDSGEIFKNEQTLPTEIIHDDRLKELDFGDLSGEKYRDFNNDHSYKHFGIEEKYDFYKRIKNFYDEINVESNIADDVVIIAHSGVGMMLYSITHDLPYEDYNNNPPPESYRLYQL